MRNPGVDCCSQAKKSGLSLIRLLRNDVAKNPDGVSHGSEQGSPVDVWNSWHDIRDRLAVASDADRRFSLLNLLENGKALGFEYGNGDLLHWLDLTIL
jgi:hypothetical protein